MPSEGLIDMVDSVKRESDLKALLIDDHPVILNALRTALSSLQIFDYIDQEKSLAEAMVRLQQTGDYDLILLDLHLSDASGIDAVIRLREKYPDVPVVIFSGDESTETMRVAFENGVLGYISKGMEMSQIINAIKTVLDGEIYIPPRYMRVLGFESPSTRPRAKVPNAPVPKMTPRQQQVFGYLLQGVPNKIICARLNIEEGTVKSHVSAIYRLFSVNSRVQLILKAAQLGLV